MTITIADGRGALWQWDTGRRVKITDGDGVKQVHYQNKCFGRSMDVDVGDDGTAIIPDELLQDWHTLTAYAYVTDDAGAYTMVQQDFIVHKRAKPAGYVYTPTDQMTLQTIQRQIGGLSDLTTEAKENLVAAINEVAASCENMGFRVADGYIQYSTDGSTWTNLIAVADLKGAKGDKGDTGAQGVKGDPGEKGDPGATGPAGPAGVPGKDGADGKPGASGSDGAKGADGITPHIGDNGNWYIGPTDTGKPSRGATGTPGKDGAGMDITGATVGQIAKIAAVDASGVPIAWSPADMPSGGGSADAVLHTAQTLTEAQRIQARKNIGALGAVTPTIRGGLFVLESDPAGTPIQVQALGYQQSATGEEYSELSITDTSPQATSDQIIISGLADFGDAEAVGRTDTAVSYAQLLGYTKPLTLNYANGQATGASYADIRKAITRGRQIKLAVANTPDIIASNAKNETDKCVLRFIHTDVGGDAVNITQYTVTAQASGLTVNVKSHEIADGSEVSY